MAKKSNRRVASSKSRARGLLGDVARGRKRAAPRTAKSKTKKKSTRARASGGGRKGASTRSKNRNRRAGETPRGRGRREPLDPAERKIRNRIALLIGVLALVNSYVFLWQGEGSLFKLGGRRAAVIGADSSGAALGSFASPRDDACSEEPVRIFDGLEDTLQLETTLAGGRSLRLALMEQGVTGESIEALERAVRTNIDLGLLASSGGAVRLALDRDGEVLALEAELAEGHLVQACRQQGEYRVRTIQHPLSPEVATIKLELGDDADLFAAVQDAEEQPELAVMIAETLVHDVDFAVEARPRDRVTVLVEKRFLGATFHRYGTVLAIRYVGAAGRFAYYRYAAEGDRARYYDRAGRPVRRALRRTPMRFHPVRAEARGMLEPLVEVVEGRLGAIYRRPEGAPVVALADGRVLEVSDDGQDGEGHTVELLHADGTRSRYSHLKRPFANISEGAEVRQGQLIGLAGHSGKTAVDRVRLELRGAADSSEADTAAEALEILDPMRCTASGEARPMLIGEALTGEQLKRFTSTIRPWRRSLLRAG